MENHNVYEEKIYDAKFPAELFCEERDEEGLYFWSHWHDEIELLYVTEGTAKVVLNQQEIILQKGNLLIVNGNTLHSGYCLQTPYQCRVISFNPNSWVQDIASRNLTYKTAIIKDSYVDRLLDQLFEEYEERKMAYVDSCKALMSLLLIHLARHYADYSQSPASLQQANQNFEKFSQVLSYIEENFDQNISNKYLAQIMHVSEDHFAHLFTKNIGMPPQRYIKVIRLQRARELIIAGNGTIAEIARKVGFTDYNYFGRQFKSYFHYTPKELYAKKLLANNPKHKTGETP